MAIKSAPSVSLLSHNDLPLLLESFSQLNRAIVDAGQRFNDAVESMESEGWHDDPMLEDLEDTLDVLTDARVNLSYLIHNATCAY